MPRESEAFSTLCMCSPATFHPSLITHHATPELPGAEVSEVSSRYCPSSLSVRGFHWRVGRGGGSSGNRSWMGPRSFVKNRFASDSAISLSLKVSWDAEVRMAVICDCFLPCRHRVTSHTWPSSMMLSAHSRLAVLVTFRSMAFACLIASSSPLPEAVLRASAAAVQPVFHHLCP
jgi:hypothetical protein